MEITETIKIPKQRIAVLIGKKGNVKKEIQRRTNTKIDVDSKEGLVNIVGEDGLSVYDAARVIKAIARGFSPEKAYLLFDEAYEFDIINIKEVAKTKKAFERIKARLIGSRGRARKNFEKLTNCYISIYGKTLAMIGRAEDLVRLKKALTMLIQGSPHAKVYRWLERKY